MESTNITAASVALQRPNGGRLKISHEALSTMRTYVQDTPEKTEACGVLLGRYIKGTGDVVVDRVTVPTSGDRRSRMRFYRARKAHQKQIDLAWDKSSGTRVYLGEWHTHPVPIPTPSWVDVLDWRRKLFVDSFATYLFFLILGTTDLAVWEGRRYRLHLEPLRLCGGDT